MSSSDKTTRSNLTNQEIAEIYRKIGIILREHGAFRVYIVQSKVVRGKNGIRLVTEVVADHLQDCTKAASVIRETLPETECTLFDGSDEENYNLLCEAEEDGIQL